MDSDETLYTRVKKGDMRAFDVLYARYETSLFGFLLSQLRSREDAEDVFHEAFLNALKSREVVFDRERGFKTWLYRIAKNLASNRARSSRRGARALTEIGAATSSAGGLPAPDAARPADDTLAEHELRVALDAAVLRLPDSLSEVYHLRSSGLSYEEIAQVLEIPLGTLKSRMNQMVTQLREDLRPWTAR
jgi:RNA polymerase sigma-70 factor (ECF subfamily)